MCFCALTSLCSKPTGPDPVWLPSSSLFLHLPPLQVQLIEQLMPQLSSRRSELDKLRRAKVQLLEKMRPDLDHLMRWRAGGYVGFDVLPEDVQRMATALTAANGWNTGGMLLGVASVWWGRQLAQCTHEWPGFSTNAVAVVHVGLLFPNMPVVPSLTCLA